MASSRLYSRADLCMDPSCPFSLYKGTEACPCLQAFQTNTSKKIVPAATQVSLEPACCKSARLVNLAVTFCAVRDQTGLLRAVLGGSDTQLICLTGQVAQISWCIRGSDKGMQSLQVCNFSWSLYCHSRKRAAYKLL